MAEPTSANQQQAANRSPTVDELFKLYVLSSLQHSETESVEFLLNSSLVNNSIQRGVSLTPDSQGTCISFLHVLSAEYSMPPPGEISLREMVGLTFQNGQMSWEKIFLILDSMVNLIQQDARNVFLLDQLCHYSEVVHLSSTGQTLSEWISGTGKEVKITEDLEESSWTIIDKKADEPEPIEVAWIKNCSCGAEPDWSIIDCRKCNKCGKYPCAIDGCTKTFNQISYADRHVKQVHTLEQQSYYEELRRRFKLHYCRCGERTLRGEDFQYVKCPKCGYFNCLRGECTSFSISFNMLVFHQRKLCKFRPPSNPQFCTNCGGQKVQNRTSVQQCPNPNCRIFWCSWCTFEGLNARSVITHIRAKHQTVC